jgi:hypothetical protein
VRSVDEDDPSREAPLKLRFAISVLISAAISVAGCSGASEEASSSIPLSGADGDPEAVEAFRVVEAAYVLFNTGDEAWMEVRDRGGSHSAGDEYTPDEGTVGYFDGRQAADAHLDISGCESHGSGEWADIADDGAVAGYYFTCTTVESNAFHGASNIELAEVYGWVVEDGEVVAVSSEGDFDEWFDYPEWFNAWVLIERPELASEIEYVFWGATRAFPTADSVPTVLEYVEEFAETQN